MKFCSATAIKVHPQCLALCRLDHLEMAQVLGRYTRRSELLGDEIQE